jgi:YfiH family protein
MKIYKDKAFNDICGDDIAYAFFGRTGGVSEGVFNSLNCKLGVGDAPESVMENRKIAAQNLCGKDAVISTLFQCHSPDCFAIDTHIDTSADQAKGDALVTDKPGLAIGILTADCGPVLFTAKKKDGSPVISAVHAGWGGAVGGILENTVAEMIRAGAERNSIAACVGPCIQQASYEVQEAFARPFLIKHEEAEHFFKAAHKPGHLMFDLQGYIAMRLALAGVRHVSLMGVDTYAEEENCFSFRRATHRGEQDYGRQMSAIMIRE